MLRLASVGRAGSAAVGGAKAVQAGVAGAAAAAGRYGCAHARFVVFFRRFFPPLRVVFVPLVQRGGPASCRWQIMTVAKAGPHDLLVASWWRAEGKRGSFHRRFFLCCCGCAFRCLSRTEVRPDPCTRLIIALPKRTVLWLDRLPAGWVEMKRGAARQGRAEPLFSFILFYFCARSPEAVVGPTRWLCGPLALAAVL